MEQRVDERFPPLFTHHRRAHDDVAQLARQAVRQFLEPVEREGERVRGLVDAEVLALQRAALLRPDEREPELTRLDTLAREDALRERRRSRLVHRLAAAVVDGDVYHRERCVPVVSVCFLYASTIRWTSLCRTTSWWPNSTNAMPSTAERMFCTWISPDACSRGRSIWVTSPVTTIFEPKPSRVRNICICSGDVFCASSRITNE